MQLTTAERKKLLPLMDDLAQAVEDLLLTGLTTASATTCKKIQVTFHEASRLKLLRLSSSLRVINEELNRFNSQSPDFSGKRLSFFINRAWLLSHGIARALEENDEDELSRLLWAAESKSMKKLEVVAIGASKKVLPGTFCAFEFRLRAVRKSGPVPIGQPLIWSCIFPLKPGVEIPPEGFLHLPQRQKFTANIFLEGNIIQIEKPLLSQVQDGIRRISLDEKSKVTSGSLFKEWERFQTWDLKGALKRLQDYRPGPLDLETELQEEVVLQDWKISGETEQDDQFVFKLEDKTGIPFEAVVSKGLEGETLLKELRKLKKMANLPPLFGVMHYERCCTILQPLSLFTPKGMKQLMISDHKLDRAALLKTLSF